MKSGELRETIDFSPIYSAAQSCSKKLSEPFTGENQFLVLSTANDVSLLPGLFTREDEIRRFLRWSRKSGREVSKIKRKAR